MKDGNKRFDFLLSTNEKPYKILTPFNKRVGEFEIYVNKKAKNLVLNKFYAKGNVMKDGNKRFDFLLSTNEKPYKFLTPFNKRVGEFEIYVNKKAKNLVLNKFYAKGNVMKDGNKRFDFLLSTNEKPYKILTPFNKRVGEFEIYVNKKAKNLVLNKFYAKGNVMKDGNKRFDFLLSTNEKPYKFELFAPSLLGKLKPGMTEAKISADHNPGQSLEIKTNFEKFTGLKLYKSGSGNERKVEVNGKELAKGDYTLTDNSFSTKITLGNDYLEPKITWEGKLPNSRQEAEAFMLKNNVDVKVTGSKRNLDLNLNWKMTKPDFDFGTPENGKISMNAKGNNPRWGDYSLSRDINWKVENKVIELNLKGMAQFAKGGLATSTPIETAVNFKVLVDKKDLIGKFMKKINGKEYSVDFPEGSGVMPKIVWGQ
jgi:DNA-binding sugar fermentation-stimulating protein